MVNIGYNNQCKDKDGYKREIPMFEEDMAFERLKDLQRERENSRLARGATVRWLALLTEPMLKMVEGLTFPSTVSRNVRERRT